MPQLSRRQFALGGLLGSLGTLSGAGFIGYNAYFASPFEPQLERIEAILPRGHENLAGLRIGFMADTHLGPSMGEDDVARAAAMLAKEQPDLVLLGGDYVSASTRYAAPVAAIFAEFLRQTPLGVFAVLGNHDVGELGRDKIVTAALEGVGIVVLRNSSALVETGRGQLWLAGVDEALMARADPVATFASIPTNAAKLALWHEPDFARHTARQGAFMQLSGHSHGGQVRLPGFGPLFLPKGAERYVIGMNHSEGMPVYTTRGVGVFQPPIRINCPPEVTLITLVSS